MAERGWWADGLLSGFDHETVLPCQFANLQRVENPEVRLACAFLQQAAKDLRFLRTTHQAEELRKLVAWFHEPPGEWPYGFVRICEALHLDVGAVRRKLFVLAT